MKKILVTLLTLLAAVFAAFAVPALPGSYPYKQPDGSVIILEAHGDEFFHWTTDASGRIVEMGADGFYRAVDPAVFNRRARSARANAQARRSRWSSHDAPWATNFGNRKILCLLAEFQPEMNGETVLFSGRYVVENPVTHFSNMLNQEGYSLNGTTGSVRDYYVDNSGGQYIPQFDVYGPVTLSHPESYYDQNGVDIAIREAYELMISAGINIPIADYDTDNNGEVDMVLFYFPGHNEAEHAPSWTIWPQQLTGPMGYLGDKQMTRCFYTSELRGNEGSEPASIGTTCHEFAHALGLPDFYDVDKATNGLNDFTTGFFDLMSSGNYNNNGRTPPYLSAVERNMLGWMDAPVTLSAAGSHTLQGIQNNVAYRIDGRESGEYFVLECRDGSKWDSYLAELGATGLVVYHIDKSGRTVPGSGRTAAYLWENTNSINCYGGHPCYYIVSSSDQPSHDSDYVFPGYGHITALEPVVWSGDPAGLRLSNIAFSNNKVSFNTSLSSGRMVFGYVKDINGTLIQNAQVVLSRSVYAFEAPSILSTDQSCETDVNGYYCFELADDASQFQVVSVRKDGYVSQASNLIVSGIFTQTDFVLFAPGQAPPATLKKYEETTVFSLGLGGASDLAVGIRYTPEELTGLSAIGATVSDVSFLLAANQGESVYVIVDLGEDRHIFNVTQGYVPNQYCTVDLSDQGLVIPVDKDVFIGVGVENVQTASPFKMYPVAEDIGGCYGLPGFLTNGALWRPITFENSYFAFAVSANLSRVSTIDFAAYGVSYITLVNGVPHVVPAAGKTVYEITWALDGAPVDGAPGAVSSLPAGQHTYMARLTYYDGTAERVYYDVTVE